MTCRRIMKKCAKKKAGFGITEVMIAAAVLGFLYLAVLNLQKGNHDAFLRIRGRDGAIEVAQQIIDSLKSVGIASIPSKENADTVFVLNDISRSWDRGLGGTVTVKYTPTITVKPTSDYSVSQNSDFQTINHVYAKQFDVTVEWDFLNSRQSISVTGVAK